MQSAGAVELGTAPDRVAAPVDDSLVNRAAHGVGWALGAFGEGIADRRTARVTLSSPAG